MVFCDIHPHSPETNSTGSTQDINCKMSLKNTFVKLLPHLSGAIELTHWLWKKRDNYIRNIIFKCTFRLGSKSISAEFEFGFVLVDFVYIFCSSNIWSGNGLVRSRVSHCELLIPYFMVDLVSIWYASNKPLPQNVYCFHWNRKWKLSWKRQHSISVPRRSPERPLVWNLLKILNNFFFVKM